MQSRQIHLWDQLGHLGRTHTLLFVAHVHFFEGHHFFRFLIGCLVHRTVAADLRGWMAVRNDQLAGRQGQPGLILPVSPLANDTMLLVVVERLHSHPR